MKARKLFTSVSVLVVALLLTACSAAAPAATPPPPVAATVVVQGKPQALVVTAAPAQPTLPAADGARADASGNTAPSGIVSASPYRQTRMIIKNGEMSLMVADTDRAIDGVTGVAVDSGGYIVSAKTWMQDGFKYAQITMGVPVDQFEFVQRRLRSLAVQVLNDTASGQDVSDEYVDAQSRLTNLEATAARIREFLSQAKNVDEALQVNAKLSEVENEIEQIKGRMQYLKDRSAFSTMVVNLEQQRPTPTPTPTLTPTPTPTPIAWMPEKTFNQAADTLSGALRALGDLLIWIGVVVVPLAVPVAIVYAIVMRTRRRAVK